MMTEDMTFAPTRQRPRRMPVTPAPAQPTKLRFPCAINSRGEWHVYGGGDINGLDSRDAAMMAEAAAEHVSYHGRPAPRIVWIEVDLSEVGR